MARGVSNVLRTGPRRVASGAAIGALYAGIASDSNVEDSVLRSMIGGALVGGTLGLGTTATGWRLFKGAAGRAGRATGIPQHIGGFIEGRAARLAAERQLPLVRRRFAEDKLIQYGLWKTKYPAARNLSAQNVEAWATAAGERGARGFVEGASALARLPYEQAAANSPLGLSIRAAKTAAGVMASRPGLAMLGAGGLIGVSAYGGPNREPLGAEMVPFAQETEIPGGGRGLDLTGPVLPPNRVVRRRMLRAMRRQEQVNTARQQRRDNSLAMLQGSTFGMVQGLNNSRHRGM